MNKTTQNDFSKRIGRYGALAAAVSGVASAEGQIVYSDPADITINQGFFYNLDINSDGTVDYAFTVNPNTGASAAFIVGSSINSMSYVSNSNQFIGTVGAASINGGNYQYPFNLANGDVISANPPSGSFLSIQGTLNFQTCYPAMEFCDSGGATVEGFIGLRFEINPGEFHFGWVRIESSPTMTIVKDFAYNATEDASLLAGQQTLSLVEETFNDVRIVALNKSIGVYNVTETTDYNVYALTGQSVLKGSISDRAHTIEANSLQTGIYILELRDKQTNAVIRKKVIL
ncbi:T9SS type A sorting domain-containing protein [Winogradskyella sp. A3E31]|uniref:T9SS type A sorting domain-containing protein n=1 Tax=Winogradskyella sp. A3E31 TaxID=3349637 RepID=UPI00398ADC8C